MSETPVAPVARRGAVIIDDYNNGGIIVVPFAEGDRHLVSWASGNDGGKVTLTMENSPVSIF